MKFKLENIPLKLFAFYTYMSFSMGSFKHGNAVIIAAAMASLTEVSAWSAIRKTKMNLSTVLPLE